MTKATTAESHEARALLDERSIAKMPPRYICLIDGACMEPQFPNGTPLMFDRDAPLAAGDFVVIWFRPEFVKPGDHQALCKRLSMAIPPWVKFPYREHPQSEIRAIIMVETTNPRRQFIVDCEHVLAAHKCIGPVPSDWTKDADGTAWRAPSPAACPGIRRAAEVAS